MATGSEILKALYIKYKGDKEKLLKAITSHEDIDIEDYRTQLEEFDKQYECYTLVEDAHKELDLNLGRNPTLLIRWNRGLKINVRRLIMHRKDRPIIGIIDPNGFAYMDKKFATPVMFVYRIPDHDYYDYGIHVYSAEDGGINETILRTSSIDEAYEFMAMVCSVLVVSNKGASWEGLPMVDDRMEVGLQKFAERQKFIPSVLVVPGKPGCFANKLLKGYINDDSHYPLMIRFADSWEDVYFCVNESRGK